MNKATTILITFAILGSATAHAYVPPAPLTRELPANPCEWTTIEVATVKQGMSDWKQNIIAKGEHAATLDDLEETARALDLVAEFQKNLLENLATCQK